MNLTNNLKDLQKSVSKILLGTMAILVVSQSPLAASDNFKKNHEVVKSQKNIKGDRILQSATYEIVVYDKLINSSFVDEGETIEVSKGLYIQDMVFNSEKTKNIQNPQNINAKSELKYTTKGNRFYETKWIVSMSENGKKEKVLLTTFTDAKKGPPTNISLTHIKPEMNSIAVQEKDIQQSIDSTVNPNGKPGFFEALGGDIDILKDKAAESISSMMPGMD
jgi:hypothetical protein